MRTNWKLLCWSRIIALMPTAFGSEAGRFLKCSDEIHGWFTVLGLSILNVVGSSGFSLPSVTWAGAICDRTNMPSTRLHASLILSGVKPSRRDEGSTCYGTNNTHKTGFDLLQYAKGLTSSAKRTNDAFYRRPEEKRGKSTKSIWPAQMSTDGAHKISGPQI